jgi:hypothetical protein
MKKLFLILAVLISVSVMSQEYRKVPVVVPTRSSTFNTFLHSGDLVYCLADSAVYYMIKKDFGPKATLTVVLASRANYVTNTVSGAVVATTGAFSGAITGATTLAITGTSVFTGAVTLTGGAVGTITGHSSLDLPLTGGTVSGATTFSVLPTFTIAAGTVTPIINADTIGAAVAGLTTNAVIMCAYKAFIASPDTLPYAVAKAGWATFYGKRNHAINYWIPKK